MLDGWYGHRPRYGILRRHGRQAPTLGLDCAARRFADTACGGVDRARRSTWSPYPHRGTYWRCEPLFRPQRHLGDTINVTTTAMTIPRSSQSVVVGVDGTQAGIDAATWALAEALSLGVPLRLIHVSAAKHACRTRFENATCDTEHAESALYRAEMAVHDMRRPVRIETAIKRGRPDCVLIDESLRAALVCVGSEGKGPCAPMPLGSTAAALAKHAHCSVAIVRTGGAPQTDTGWIAAVQNDEPDNDAVVHRAMEEGRLRRAPVLLIDRRLDSWIRRYPDVHVQSVAENHSDSI
jgi:nucleotide-binding universal stress UspA family protein